MQATRISIPVGSDSKHQVFIEQEGHGFSVTLEGYDADIFSRVADNVTEAVPAAKRYGTTVIHSAGEPRKLIGYGASYSFPRGNALDQNEAIISQVQELLSHQDCLSHPDAYDSSVKLDSGTEIPIASDRANRKVFVQPGGDSKRFAVCMIGYPVSVRAEVGEAIGKIARLAPEDKDKVGRLYFYVNDGDDKKDVLSRIQTELSAMECLKNPDASVTKFREKIRSSKDAAAVFEMPVDNQSRRKKGIAIAGVKDSSDFTISFEGYSTPIVNSIRALIKKSPLVQFKGSQKVDGKVVLIFSPAQAQDRGAAVSQIYEMLLRTDITEKTGGLCNGCGAGSCVDACKGLLQDSAYNAVKSTAAKLKAQFDSAQLGQG